MKVKDFIEVLKTVPQDSEVSIGFIERASNYGYPDRELELEATHLSYDEFDCLICSYKPEIIWSHQNVIELRGDGQ